MESKIPTLTVRLVGYGWKAHINVHVLMVSRGIRDVRDFVRLYLRRMPLSDENREAVRRITGWFLIALEVAKEGLAQAVKDYHSGYQGPDSYEYPPKFTPAQEQSNKRLLKKVEAARKTLDRIEKRKAVFLEECAAYKIPVD